MPQPLIYLILILIGFAISLFVFRNLAASKMKILQIKILALQNNKPVLDFNTSQKSSWLVPELNSIHNELDELRAERKTEVAKEPAPDPGNDKLKELTEKSSQLEIVNQLGQSVTASLKLDDTARQLFNSINSLMDAAVVEIGIYSWKDNSWEFLSNLSGYSIINNGYINPIAEWCLKNRQEVHLSYVSEEYGKYLSNPIELSDKSLPESVMCFPVLRNGKEQGTLTIASYRQNAFNEEHLNLMHSLLPYTSVAFENSLIHRELLLTQSQLIENEKMALIGQLSSGIAHEIINPLNSLNNFSEISQGLLQEIEHKDGSEKPADLIGKLSTNLDKISYHGNQAFDIVKSIMMLSRKGVGEKTQVNINKLITDFLNIAYQGFIQRHDGFECKITKDLDLGMPVKELIAEDISRVLYNLYTNAFYSMNEKLKKLRAVNNESYIPELFVKSQFKDSTYYIMVKDNGLGIPEEIKDKIFLPFFSTKPPGEGTGLGLSLSHNIIEEGNFGKLSATSELGHWTEFSVEIPS